MASSSSSSSKVDRGEEGKKRLLLFSASYGGVAVVGLGLRLAVRSESTPDPERGLDLTLTALWLLPPLRRLLLLLYALSGAGGLPGLEGFRERLDGGKEATHDGLWPCLLVLLVPGAGQGGEFRAC